MLIYKITLGELLTSIAVLKKIIQLRWLETLTNWSPSLFEEPGIDWMNNQDSS